MSTTSDNTTTGSRTTLGQYLGLLGRYLRPQRRMVALMAVLLLATIGLQLLIPQVLRTFIDAAVGDAEVVALGRMALLFLAIALLNQLFGAGATYAGADVGWRATNAMRAELMRHCLRLDMRFHTAHTAGEMIERIDGDVTALSNFFSQFSVRVLGGMLLLGGILVLLWLENPWIGLALTGFTALQLLVLLRLRSLGVPATKLERENSAQLFGFIEERLAGIEDLRANGGGPHAMHRFGAVIRTFFFGTRRAWLLQSVVWLSSFGLFIVGIGVTLGASIALMTRGIITIGTGYMVFQYMLMLQNPVEQISRQLQELQKAAASIGRVQQLFAERSTLPAGRGRPLPAGPLEVVFEGVSFAYHPGTPILQGIDLRLEPGQVLGLLGRTGSGKTSLTRLLFRLYDVDEGSVRLGGVDTRDADLEALRARVGLVTQEVQLFQASVRDNLTFFDPAVDNARLRFVLEELGMGDWLASLPNGLDAVLTAAGGNLSAGEAQLLAFARVFLKDPGLVILDEPSSRLDPATEQRLAQALTRLLQGRTAIIVAHRLETVERVDEVLVLDDGRVAEFGPRERLAGEPGSHYARLLRAGHDLDAFEPHKEFA